MPHSYFLTDSKSDFAAAVSPLLSMPSDPCKTFSVAPFCSCPTNGGSGSANKYQLECGPEQCEELARAAAYKIARGFCSRFSRGKGDYEANCRAVAIMSCPGYILGKIEELIGNNTCEDKDVPPDTGELLTLQQQCEETVDYLLSRRLRLGKK